MFKCSNGEQTERSGAATAAYISLRSAGPKHSVLFSPFLGVCLIFVKAKAAIPLAWPNSFLTAVVLASGIADGCTNRCRTGTQTTVSDLSCWSHWAIIKTDFTCSPPTFHYTSQQNKNASWICKILTKKYFPLQCLSKSLSGMNGNSQYTKYCFLIFFCHFLSLMPKGNNEQFDLTSGVKTIHSGEYSVRSDCGQQPPLGI